MGDGGDQISHRARNATDADQTKPTNNLASIVFGSLLGLDALAMAFALSLFIFSGDLAFGVPLGLSLLILSTIIISVVSYFLGQSRSSVSLAQDSSLAVLAPAVIVAAMAAQGGQNGMLATAIAVIACTTILSGLLMVLVSRPSIGRILKLVPFSVSVGFLASSGWLLTYAAIASVTEAESLAENVVLLSDPRTLYLIIPTIALGLTLIFVSNLGAGVLPILIVFGLSIGIFYGFLWVTGVDIETARAHGFLFNQSVIQPSLTELFGLYAYVDVSAIWHVGWPILGASLISVLACMLNITGLELVARQDMNLNNALRSTGFANLLIGGFGGAPSYSTIGSSALVVKFGVGTPLFHVVYVAIAVLGLAFASTIVSLAPTFASAGFLMYIGLSLIQDWLINTRNRVPLSEWLVALSIFLMTIFFGIQVALLVGLGLALLLFVSAYASLPIIRLRATGSALKSNVDRQDTEMRFLDETGEEVAVVALQGYLFFGSIDRLIDTFDEHRRKPLRFFVLDLGHVTGIDASASSSLVKLGFLAELRDITLVYCNVSKQQKKLLARWDIAPGKSAVGHFSDTLDQALEWCENALLHDAALPETEDDPTEVFFGFFDQPENWVTKLEVPAGTTLITAGKTDQDFYFLADGRLSAWIKSNTGTPVRVRSFGAGTYVGEIAMLTQQARSADIVADIPSTVYALKHEDFLRLKQENPAAALRLYHHLARNLAHSLQRSNLSLRQLNA